MMVDTRNPLLPGEQWIAPADGGTVPSGAPRTAGAYFLRVFRAQAGEHKTVRVTASTRYALFLNGSFIHNGPCKGDQWRQYVDTVDLTPWLAAGENVLSAQVLNYSTVESAVLGCADGGPSAVHSKPTGPLLLLRDESAATEDISTRCPGWLATADHSTHWVAYPRTWYVGTNQCIDGAKVPQGWPLPLEGRNWPAAKAAFTEEPSQYGEMQIFRLRERPIPLQYAKPGAFVRQVPARAGESSFRLLPAPGTVPAGQKACAELDAGELLTAYPRLRVSGGRGAKITVKYAECYITQQGKDRRDDWQNGWLEGYEDSFLPSGRGDLFLPFWFRTFRFVRVEVEAGEHDCAIEGFDFVETGYPLERVSAVASEANPWVEQLFHISANTLARCMHETYEDCPYHEQLQYTQDTRLEMLFTYALSADTRMARRTIEDYHSSLLPEGMLQSRYPSRTPQVIPGFALHWFFMLEDYYRQTGDASLARRYRPTMDAVLDWFGARLDADGFFNSDEYWPYFDWVDGWQNGVPDAVWHGPSTVINLLYAMGLQCAARLSRLTGREAVAAEYEQRAGSIFSLVESKCWDAEAGLYREGPEFRQFSQHAQVWAVLTGLAQGERARSILHIALNDPSLKQCSFTMMYYLYRALQQAGMYEETRGLWSMWTGLLERGCTTIPEVPTDPRSECHAWGALALWDFPRYFLGVREGQPGWGSVVIEPACLWLGDCSGRAATPHGAVEAAWRVRDGRFAIHGRLPAGIPGELRLPDGSVLPISGAFSAECEL